MRRVTVTNRTDALIIRVGRDHARLGLHALGFATFLGLLLAIDRDTGFGLIAFMLNLAVLPVFGVLFFRAARRSERTLVRANGRLLLDGEPLEMARVELRVLKMPITRVPTGYSLSLWVMAAGGPEDVPIGHSRTLIEASTLSGQLEDFVQRANVKQHRHV
jgi:hypothetical protein